MNTRGDYGARRGEMVSVDSAGTLWTLPEQVLPAAACA
jgi:hypothetical protein